MIAVASARGGSGKTTIACALAWAIARLLSSVTNDSHLAKVALLDLDPQGSLAECLGTRRPKDPLNDPPLAMHGLIVYGGGARIAGATATEIMDHIARASATADVVVVDCPPELTSVPHVAALQYPADLVLGIARLEPGSVQPIQRLTAVAAGQGIAHLVLPNVATAKPNAMGTLIALQAVYSTAMTTIAGAPHPVLLPYEVPGSEYAPTSITKRVPLTAFRPKAAPSRAVQQLADDLHTWRLI